MQRRFLTLILFLLTAGSGSAQNGTLICSNPFTSDKDMVCKPTYLSNYGGEYFSNGAWNFDFNNTAPLKGSYSLQVPIAYDTLFVSLNFSFKNTNQTPTRGSIDCIPIYSIGYSASNGKFYSRLGQSSDNIQYATPASRSSYSTADKLLSLVYVKAGTELTLFKFERATIYLVEGTFRPNPEDVKQAFCDTMPNPTECLVNAHLSPMDCQLQFAYDNIEVRGKNAIVTDIQTENLSQASARVLRTYTLLGQELEEQQPYTGFVIQYYSDGTRRKEWREEALTK